MRTLPEGSALQTHLTELWMEIGDHAVYQVGRRIGQDKCVFIRGAKTLRESNYPTGLRLDVVFNRVSRTGSSSSERRAVQKIDRGVDEHLGVSRPAPPYTRPVTPILAALTNRPFDFVEITTIVTQRNIKRLRVQTAVSLPPFSGEQWLLELGFPNLPNRILRPAESDIIPSGL